MTYINVSERPCRLHRLLCIFYVCTLNFMRELIKVTGVTLLIFIWGGLLYMYIFVECMSVC